jgi:hypothetical protein
MKARHNSWASFLLLAALVILINSCDQPKTIATGDIPYNEDSVKSHIISIDVARTYTSTFRNMTDTFDRQLPQLKSGYDLGRAEAFNRDVMALLLNQKDSLGNPAAGIRIYYGLDKGGQVRTVLVPYDKNGNDIIKQLITDKAVSIPGVSSAKAYWDNGQVIENGQRCPTACSGTGGL